VSAGVRPIMRAARFVIAETIGFAVYAIPTLEARFVRTGKRLKTRPWRASLYWHSHEALARRLRRAGGAYRAFDVGPFRIQIDVADFSGYMRYFHDEPFEPQLTELVATTLREGDVFVDVGANSGLFTVIAARATAPSGLAVAFEPHPGARGRLEKSVHRNGVTNVVIEACALGEAERSADLFLSDDSVLSTLDPSRSPARGYGFPRRLRVPITTLDAWLSRHPEIPRGRLSLIKVDVEGTEDEVIRGMLSTLRACPQVRVVCETSPGTEADQLLRSVGLHASLLDRRRGEFGNYLYQRLTRD
jgi:FkbM family methyltransferase